MHILRPPARAQQLLWVLLGADMNSTADQAFVKIGTFTNYLVQAPRVVNPSISLTTAAGGIYNEAAKAGTPIVASSQAYSALNATVAGLALTVNGAQANGMRSDTALYLSLTTPQGAAATADFYIFGIVL